MAASFFFYDLETSGISPREARIMQFAGQRTDMDLKPIGEPVNLLIKLSPDVLPDPEAILLTGITPQQTLVDGLTEAEFLRFFYDEVVKADTTFVGFNTVRFDDEFMRFLHYRNFYEPYEWQWANGCSRWDILDLTRLTRALKPEGINWPYTPEGKPTNRLELLTKLNGLDHSHAHDALNDVMATIAVARLIREKQPELFDYVYKSRSKAAVKKIVDSGKPFMYASGRYPAERLHTTAAVLLGRHAEQDYALVYDLAHDPQPFLKLDIDQLIEAWSYSKDPQTPRLPVKTLKYNRCPAVVPGIVSDEATLKRLHLNRQEIARHLSIVAKHGPEFVERLFAAVRKLDERREREQKKIVNSLQTVDGRLYDGFLGPEDKNLLKVVRGATGAELGPLTVHFKDQRLQSLLPLYKARNYPAALSSTERADWDAFVTDKLFAGGKNSRLARYFARLAELSKTDSLNDSQRYVLEELQLYGESVMPSESV